jgi:threonyl-tRNA synthetase
MDDQYDHRVIGRELGLFDTHELVGAGLPLWYPDGAAIRAELERFAAEEATRTGCRRVYTPVMGKRELYERSGHWQKFHDDIFPPMKVGHDEFVLRPANCPHHALVYASRQRSYRELPVRLAELGSMFRSELSGVLGGLSRVRQINLDDAHVFCAPEQIGDEVLTALGSVLRVYEVLGIEVAYFRLSRRGDGDTYLGDDDLWERAEGMLAAALDQLGLAYVDAPGEAAFYGPKVDVQVKDPAGREETLSTVQLDFNQPERFDLTYIGADGQAHRPVMIHRGTLSAMERMVAHLLELYAGAFPVWLAPVQVAVLPVAAEHADAAWRLARALADDERRVEVDDSDNTLALRVRRARERKAPYVLVLGDREVGSGTVAVRRRDGQRMPAVPIEEFRAHLADLVRSRGREL